MHVYMQACFFTASILFIDLGWHLKASKKDSSRSYRMSEFILTVFFSLDISICNLYFHFSIYLIYLSIYLSSLLTILCTVVRDCKNDLAN